MNPANTLLDLEQDIQWNTILYLLNNKKSFNIVIAVDNRFKNDLPFLDIGEKQGILNIPVNERFHKNIEVIEIFGETQLKIKISITIDEMNSSIQDDDFIENFEDKIITLKLRKYDIISVILIDENNNKTKVISNMTHYPLRPQLNKKSLVQQLIDESK